MASDPAQDRIAQLEAEIAQLRQRADLNDGLRQLNLTVEKARSKAAGDEEALGFAASTWSTACCLATVSSASSYCVVQEGDFSLATADPEMAQAFVTLHRRAVEVMGEEGAVNALIEQAGAHDVIRLELPQPE
jgi:hypothetical protein